MTIPTTRPTSIIGAATSTITQIPSRAMSRTWAPFIPIPQSVSGKACAILRLRNAINKSIWCGSPFRRDALDRHPHDFLVGGNHLVADCHHALHRELRLADGGN